MTTLVDSVGVSKVSETQRLSAAITEDYRRRSPGSAAFFARAESALVGGVSGSLRYFKPYPLYFQGGDGAYMTDIDGHRYIDCFLCNGPLMLGHQPPQVVEAMRAHASTGSLVVNPVLATQVAEQLQATVPCAQRVRFVNTGTEAVMTALRTARAATGRRRIVKFFGHYHGQEDQVLVGLGTVSSPLGSGIPEDCASATTVLPYGDIEVLTKTLATNTDVAAVLLDPAMHSGGLWGSQADYLAAVRSVTREYGVLLIFDEVITGFRLALGGAQAYYGVDADLAIFAKALSCGEKLGALVGRKDVMDVLDPRQERGQPRAYQSGTTNDGTSALAAAHAALLEYQSLHQSGGYATLSALGDRLSEGLRGAFQQCGIPCHVNQLGSMMQLFITDAEPNFDRYIRLSQKPVALFTLAMLCEGVVLGLPGSPHIYLSFRHSQHDVDAIVRAAERVLEKYDFSVF